MSAGLRVTRNYVVVRDARKLENNPEERAAWYARWPNFSPLELCTWDFSLRIATDALDGLQAVRTDFGYGMYVTSAARNWVHNTAVGGKQNSSHLTESVYGAPKDACAFDIALSSRAMAEKIEALAVRHGFTSVGRYPVSRFIHIDMRPAKPNGLLRWWGRKDWSQFR